MAIAPLNEFKSICVDLTDSSQDIITVPVSIATIILDARAVNTTGTPLNPSPESVGFLTVGLLKSDNINESLVVPEMEIPPHDSLQFIEGKFVMQEGDVLYAFANSSNKLQLIISYLETSA